MDWSDEGFVLSARRYGETSLVVNLLTREHGRHGGLVRGGASSRNRGLYQPGNHLRAQWRGRLTEHLGTYRCELIYAHAADNLETPLPLMALSTATALLDISLPDRAPSDEIFMKFKALIVSLGDPGWEGQYVKWELGLLSDLGFGLDLSECAATGVEKNLIYVSPRSGRAVSAAAGQKYHNKLLRLPDFLLGDNKNITGAKLCQGLSLTGFFFKRHVIVDKNNGLPPVRDRLIERFKLLRMVEK